MYRVFMLTCAGLSHEQLLQLRDIIKASGSGKQGHSRTPEENARALLHIRQHQQQGLSFNAAIKVTAAAEVACPSTLRTAMKEFQQQERIEQKDRRSHPSHPFYRGESGPSLDGELLIHRLLLNVQENNTFESCETLRVALADELGVVVCKRTVHSWLHALGYTYGKKHFINSPASYSNALIRRHIYKYAKALKEQEEGKAMIVYMDESYIHAHHCSLFLWYSLTANRKSDVRGDNRGKRIIIMHAMSKDGLLEVEGVEPSNILTELYHSCALIFNEVCVDGITPADYHDTINGEKFIGWIQQRLLPTFKKKYPGKKMYLVLDNAKYHHHRGPDWFAPATKTKGQLADFLRQRKVKNITVNDERVIPASKFSADARGMAGGPTVLQLKEAAKLHLKQHPEINTTVPQQLLDDAGYELLYTPPYVSELQPIELIWAYTKSLVARQSSRTRSVDTAAIQTREAMASVTAELCGKVISHCHKWIDAFMKSDNGGSLRRFADLNALMAAPAESQIADDTAEVSMPSPVNDENEENESQWTQ
jgi:transposase